MNIVFINSPLQDYSKTKKQEYYTTPPLGLGYLATIAKNLGNNVSLIDSEALGLSQKQTSYEALSRNPDVVGINLISPTLNLSKKIIQDLKISKPRLKIITGGPHATIRPEQVLKDIPEIDILFRGEGELTLEELIKNEFNPDSIKGVSYRKNRDIIQNSNRELNNNLDSLPFIDREFFVNDPYYENHMLKSVVIGSRGCPYLCTFCSGPLVSGKKIRTRSIDNIIEELKILKHDYNINSVHFIDNDFIYNKSRILNFADELEKNKLNINWRALARVDIVSRFGKKFLKRIKQTGCYQLVFGIESGSQRILDLVKKGTTPEQAREAVNLCKEAGIKTKAYYMFGFPTETMQEMEQTLNHAKTLNTDVACFILAKAYPGTEMHSSLLKDYTEEELLRYMHLQDDVPLNNIRNKNFDKYHISNELSFSKASNEDLRKILRKAYKMYYADGNRKIKYETGELIGV